MVTENNFMDQHIINKICSKIKESSNPLVIIPKNPSGDAVGSALGLYLTIRKLDKTARIACPSAISRKYIFFPGFENIRRNMLNEELTQISFDLGGGEIQKIYGERKAGKLRIHIRAKNNALRVDSMRIDKPKCEYDLIVVISSPKLELLGEIYTKNKKLFTKLPIINISNDSAIMEYGSTNLVDSSYFCVSEIIAELSDLILNSNLDSEISTALLAGIISESDNFQSSKCTSRTYSIVKSLFEYGARKEEIIKYLYKFNHSSDLLDVISYFKFDRNKFRINDFAIKQFDEYCRKNKLESRQRFVVFIVLLSIAYGVIAISEKEGRKYLLNNKKYLLPERNIAYASANLPISEEAEKFFRSLESIFDANTNQYSNTKLSKDVINKGDTKEMSSKFGFPKNLAIPTLRIDASVQYIGLSSEGAMDVPSNSKDVAWYKFGVKPGEKGNAVIAGHKDWFNDKNGVFSDLNKLKIGDYVYVVDDRNNKHRFKVAKKQSYKEGTAPMEEIFGLGNAARLNLITCVGSWNKNTQSYSERLVVYTELDSL